MSNPLRCEVGDQSGKMGQYSIGMGKRFYTDVNVNLEGKYAGTSLYTIALMQAVLALVLKYLY